MHIYLHVCALCVHVMSGTVCGNLSVLCYLSEYVSSVSRCTCDRSVCIRLSGVCDFGLVFGFCFCSAPVDGCKCL